jgi:flagellar basal-body rod modification protein FlgD
MSVPATSSTQGNQQPAVQSRTARAGKLNTLNYNNFLTLLLTQMKNQDPTNPMKSTEYMGQLATFSQVEQSVNINSKLDALLTASSLAQAGSLVGSTVTSADKSVTGRVVSAHVTDDGLVAHLDNGKDVTCGSGVTVS